MELIEVIAAVIGLVVGVIFGYLQVVVPITRGELKFTKKFPFVVGTDISGVDDNMIQTGTRPDLSSTPGTRTRTATILVTDMVGFLTKKLQNETLVHELIDEQRHLLQTIFTKHNGKELTVLGDKSVVEFKIPLEAIMCAIEIQESFEERNASLPPEREVQLRLGIHTGEVTLVEREGVTEVTGQTVDTAFGIEKLVDPGGICFTEAVYGQVRNRLEDPALPVSKGERKGIDLQGAIYKLVLPWQRKSLPLSYRLSFTLQRTTSRILTIVVLIIMTFSAYLIFTREAESGEPIPIAVVDFVNQTGEPELNGLSGMLITSLEQSRKLSVITRSRMFDILKQLGKEDVEGIDELLGREICKQANLEILVTASIRKFGELYTIDLKVLDPNKNEYIFAVKGEGEGQESIPSMIDDLSEKTRSGLRERTDEIRTASRKISDLTTVNMEAYQHYFLGNQLINSLDFEEAEEEFRKAVALDSTFGLAWYKLSYTLGWNNEKLAREPLEKSLSLLDRIPEKERFLVRSSKARADGGFEKGLEILREMQKDYPDDKELIYRIGDWSYHSGELDSAFKYLETVLTIDPIFERALQHMVWTCRSMDRLDDMFDYAKRYATVTESAESYFVLGEASYRLNNLDEGLQLLQLLRAVSPERHAVSAAISRMFQYMGAFDRAEAELTSLINESGNREAQETGLTQLVDLDLYRGKYNDALRTMDELTVFFNEEYDTVDIAVTHILKGLIYYWGWKDSLAARAEIERTIPYQASIKDPEYWGILSYLHVSLGDKEAAERVAAEWVKELPWVMPTVDIFVPMRAGNCPEADSLTTAILAEDKSEPLKIPLFFVLAECYFENGEWEEAIEKLTKVQTIYYPGMVREVYYPISYYLLGRCYEEIGDKALSIKNYETFLEIWRDGDEAHPMMQDAIIRYAALKDKTIS